MEEFISGKSFNVSAVDLTIYAKGETLTLFFLKIFSRSFNKLLISASSCWVTCGMLIQDECKLFSAVFSNFESSFFVIFPHLEKSISVFLEY